eukprot:m.248578 g.248578  ORF g.248578 m.248578 type:complete len:637 (+) comp16134_c0_seq6:155-2065(+)
MCNSLKRCKNAHLCSQQQAASNFSAASSKKKFVPSQKPHLVVQDMSATKLPDFTQILPTLLTTMIFGVYTPRDNRSWKLELYDRETTEELHKALKQKAQSFKKSRTTIGGTFEYAFEFLNYETYSKDAVAKKGNGFIVGTQENLHTGTKRKIACFDLKLMGSPTGAIWMTKDEMNNDVILQPRLCVQSEIKYWEGDTQHAGVQDGNIVTVNFEHRTWSDIAAGRKRPMTRVLPSPEVVEEIIKYFRQQKALTLKDPTVDNIEQDACEAIETVQLSSSSSSESESEESANNQKASTSRKRKRKENTQKPTQNQIRKLEQLEKILPQCHRLRAPLTRTRLRLLSTDDKMENILDKEQVLVILHNCVPDIETMTTKEQVPVTESIWGAYTSGIPGQEGLRVISRNQLQSIFSTLSSSEVNNSDKCFHLRNIADSWTGCRSEQIRAVNKVYGLLSGRDQSFEQQVTLLLDSTKDMSLQRVAIWMVHNVKALRSLRLPHLFNRLKVDLHTDLGLSGVEAAEEDIYIAPPLTRLQQQQALDVYHNIFHPIDFVKTVTTQINACGVDNNNNNEEQVITREAFQQWVQTLGTRKGQRVFDEYTLLYNEEEDYLYDHTPKNTYDVYVHDGVTIDILRELFAEYEQ